MDIWKKICIDHRSKCSDIKLRKALQILAAPSKSAVFSTWKDITARSSTQRAILQQFRPVEIGNDVNQQYVLLRLLSRNATATRQSETSTSDFQYLVRGASDGVGLQDVIESTIRQVLGSNLQYKVQGGGYIMKNTTTGCMILFGTAPAFPWMEGIEGHANAAVLIQEAFPDFRIIPLVFQNGETMSDHAKAISADLERTECRLAHAHRSEKRQLREQQKLLKALLEDLAQATTPATQGTQGDGSNLKLENTSANDATDIKEATLNELASFKSQPEGL